MRRRMIEDLPRGRNGSFTYQAEGKAFGVGAMLVEHAVAVTSTKDSDSLSSRSGWSLPEANRILGTPIVMAYCPASSPIRNLRIREAVAGAL